MEGILGFEITIQGVECGTSVLGSTVCSVRVWALRVWVGDLRLVFCVLGPMVKL